MTKAVYVQLLAAEFETATALAPELLLRVQLYKCQQIACYR